MNRILGKLYVMMFLLFIYGVPMQGVYGFYDETVTLQVQMILSMDGSLINGTEDVGVS